MDVSNLRNRRGLQCHKWFVFWLGLWGYLEIILGHKVMIFVGLTVLMAVRATKSIRPVDLSLSLEVLSLEVLSPYLTISPGLSPTPLLESLAFLSKPLQDKDGSECNCCFKLRFGPSYDEHKVSFWSLL
ncbi:uncharacterized protein LOC131299214 [Rhododendron vialii]|uniref:uncharacterized protein LOC131299214 n=1 Tax=Rhododendron vialii TaxID=182163 RepID=UPI00265EE082|nr:uncharacterized protein LOC131299214 [Rhododendron vialii]